MPIYNWWQNIQIDTECRDLNVNFVKKQNYHIACLLVIWEVVKNEEKIILHILMYYRNDLNVFLHVSGELKSPLYKVFETLFLLIFMTVTASLLTKNRNQNVDFYFIIHSILLIFKLLTIAMYPIARYNKPVISIKGNLLEMLETYIFY